MRNLKRALSLALSSVMLLGMMVVGTSAASYPDVDANDNLEAIQVLQILGVMEGDEQGNFNPDAKITRNEMAVIMTHLLNLSEGGTTPFTDVPAWAQPYVGAIYNAGVTSGTSATTYGGSSNVTAVEAALMVMKALGYFGYQGEFGDNWTVAVVKQATKIGLFDGVSAASTSAITRSEAAQICLNALESTVTVVTQTGGGSVVAGDANVSLTASYSYEDVKNTAFDYARTDGTNDGVQQLCEKLYGRELKKDGASKDDFGRTATSWTYKGESVISANAADATYTAEVSSKTIYSDLKLSSDVKNATVYTDGKYNTGSFDIEKNNSTDKIGGNGVLVEVYKTYDEDGTVSAVDIAVINTYLGEVTDVDTNSDGERYVTVDGMDYKTAAFAEEDMVLYTKAQTDASTTEIATMALATVVENVEVTRVTSDTSFVAGGTTYKYAQQYDGTKTNVAATPNTSSVLNLYVDAYGYVIGYEKYKDASDYAYVIDVAQEGSWSTKDYYARLLMADGTVAEVKIDKDSYDANVKGYIVDFTKDSKDVYTLAKHGQAAGTLKGDLDINKGESKMTIGGTVYYANAKTLFLIQKGEGDDATYTAYTGIANVPNLSGNNITGTVYATSSNLANVVYLKDVSTSTESTELVYVLLNTKEENKDSEIGAFYTYDAVVNGKITTIDFAASDAPSTTGVVNSNVAVYKTMNYNGDNLALASKCDPYTGSGDEYVVKGTAAGKISDGTIQVGDAYYTVSDDVKVYEVDTTDKEISTASTGKIVKDSNVEMIVQNAEVVAIFWLNH